MLFNCAESLPPHLWPWVRDQRTQLVERVVLTQSHWRKLNKNCSNWLLRFQHHSVLGRPAEYRVPSSRAPNTSYQSGRRPGRDVCWCILSVNNSITIVRIWMIVVSLKTLNKGPDGNVKPISSTDYFLLSLFHTSDDTFLTWRPEGHLTFIIEWK